MAKGIYAQRFDATGNSVGAEFRVNTFPAGDRDSSSVAMASNGDFIVVWSSNGQDSGDKRRLRSAFNAAEGVAKQGGEFLINATTTRNQDKPAVALVPDGSFIITWKWD